MCVSCIDIIICMSCIGTIIYVYHALVSRCGYHASILRYIIMCISCIDFMAFIYRALVSWYVYKAVTNIQDNRLVKCVIIQSLLFLIKLLFACLVVSLDCYAIWNHFSVDCYMYWLIFLKFKFMLNNQTITCTLML